ncbi:MAG: prepilin-type N-terminal cleavage/methylation domain-containing protein [Candidatus Omnitrophota bacterium]
MMYRSAHQHNGFSLIELMVVIAVLAALAVGVLPQIYRNINKGKTSAVEKFYGAVKNAAVAYFSDNKVWPATSATGADFMVDPGGSISATWDGPYLDRWQVADPWGGTYAWYSLSSGANFNLSLAGERYISITSVPLADAQRLDRFIDITLNASSGWVRYIPVGSAYTVNILVSRDGEVN